MLAPSLRQLLFGVSTIALQAAATLPGQAADWTRFRGENGAGVSHDSAPLPAEWDDAKNVAWSVDLPGAGKSSPIIVGDRVILTAWTGTGPEDLVRHVVCYDRKTGDELWKKEVPPAVTDEAFRGMFTENGYASHTPATDGDRIYCFFGVTGVMAYDMDGNVVWGPVSVGTEFNERNWGSASSPILYKDMVIVTAGAESRAMVALDKNTGEVRWNQPADALGGIWGTPVVMDGASGEQDLVVGVGGELWGVNPANGKLRWYAVAGEGDGARMSAIVDGGLAIMLDESRGGGGRAIAVPGGGTGDVTDKIAWSENYRGNIGTPVCHDGLIYWVRDGQLNCVDAKTGEQVYQERLQAPGGAAADGANAAPGPGPGGPPPDGEGPGPGGPPPGRPDGGPSLGGPGGPGPGGPGGGGRRGGRGGMGGQDYSSPIIADGKIYFARRSGEVYVFAAGREFKQLAVNKFSGEGDYSATPAASDGQLFIRSDKKLYCIASAE